MTDAPTLTTQRLRLRGWRESDLAEYAALNADPRVMRFLRKALDRTQSDALVERFRAEFAERGFSQWAVELIDGGQLVGAVGLTVPKSIAHLASSVEIGWRLAYEHWGHGYATEAARAVMEFGFQQLLLPEIVSFTAAENRRSRAVMERLGMTHSPADDFDHPLLPEGHPLRRQVLYTKSP